MIPMMPLSTENHWSTTVSSQKEDDRMIGRMKKIFDKMTKEVYEEILKNGFYLRTITVICRFSGFETHTKSKTFKTSTNDLEAFKKDSKYLLLRFIVENPKPIRLVGIRASNLSRIKE